MITLVGVKSLPDLTSQWVFVNIVVDGQSINHTVVQPRNNDSNVILSSVELSNYLNDREELYRIDILKNMYQGYDGSDLTQWKLDNPDVIKVPYTGNHDGLYDRQINGSRIKQTTLNEIDAATTVDELKIVLKKILIGNPNVVNPNA